MNSNIVFMLIVFIIFGSGGVMFLRRASKNATQQAGSKIDGTMNKLKVGIDLIVGGWFIIFAIVVMYFTLTRFLLQ